MAPAEALHAAQLLTDDERNALEDTLADAIDALATSPASTDDAVQQAMRMTALAGNVSVDSALARQLRHKFVS